MADGTKIEWTEATWNPITGCSVVSPGCTNCYAMRLAGTRLAHHPSRAGLTRDTKAGPVWTGEVRLNEEWLDQPLRWTRPRMVFVCAHGDLFHENVPDEWIDRVFAVMASAPWHTFQVLTKRTQRARFYLSDTSAFGPGSGTINRIADVLQNVTPAWVRGRWPLPNVWLGVSVEDQARADERIPILLDTPAAVRWVSAEPLLGPVDLTACKGMTHTFDALLGSASPPDELVDLGVEPMVGPRLDWVVIGGESGRDARRMDIAWASSLVEQCRAAGVAVFVKQLGQLTIDGPVQRLWHDPKGGDPAEWPLDLRVREWPRG